MDYCLGVVAYSLYFRDDEMKKYEPAEALKELLILLRDIPQSQFYDDADRMSTTTLFRSGVEEIIKRMK